MAVDNLEIIDAVSIDKDGRVVLTVSDHLIWSELDHLSILQDKLNVYLTQITSGAIYDLYDKARGKDIVISVAFKFTPTQVAIKFLERVRQQLLNLNIGFEYYQVVE